MDFAERYGPWAVIAGASEGTGRAFAHRVAALGLPSILVARRAEPLAVVAEEIRQAHGLECVTATVDLARADATDRIAEAVGEREVGLFISNAGADPNGARFLDRDVSVWTDLVQRNVMTTMRNCHYFAGPMKARGRGGILLVNSGACYGGASFMSCYSSSKAFDLCFGEAIWAELKPHGVHVLDLILGMTDTPAFRKLLAEKGLPVPDNIASPDDVARVGLERLPFGPVHNWGLADDDPGYAITSAAERRARVEMIDKASVHVFGTD